MEICSLLPKNNLSDITEHAINKAGYLNCNELLNQIFVNNKISKRQLRRQFLNHDIPLTRLDTHILFKEISDGNDTISKQEFMQYLNNEDILYLK